MLNVNWGGSSLTTSTTQAVYIRRRWSDNWMYQPNIWAQERTWSLLPATPTAMLTLDYGYVLPHGGSVWTTQAKLNIGGWYVKIVDTCADGGLLWCGFIDEVADDQGGMVGVGPAGIPTGRQTFVAYAMSQLLAHETVTRTRWNDPLNNADRWAGSAGTFNANGKGNMSAAQTSITDDNVFDYGHLNRDFGTFWSSRDIVRYLFKYVMPLDHDGQEKIKFRIDGLDLVPNWDRPTIDQEGKSVLSLLNEIINPSRMLQLSTSLDESTNPNTVVFRVHSLSLADLSLPNGETHPGNASTITLTTAAAHDTNVATQGSVTSKVDQVVVKGARRSSVFGVNISAKGSGDTLWEEAWSSTVETAYETGASTRPSYTSFTDSEKRRANEIVRSRVTVQDAYRIFQISDQMVSDTQTGTGVPLFAIWRTDDEPPQVYWPWWGETRFLPQLPFKRGVDYSGTIIADNSHNDEEKPNSFRSPLVLFKRDGTDTYLQAERMANIDNDPSFSVAVGIEYDGKCFSLEVQGAEQHAIAHNQFTALPVDRTTTELGSWDYRDAQCTMHVEEDRFVEARYPADDELPTTLDAIRRKVFYAGAAYQLIDVLQATPVDVDDDGELKTVTTSGGAYLRDDRDKLKSLALLAASWWLVTRKVARIVSARPSATVAVGQLLTAINPGTSQADTINTVISEIRLATPLAENSPALPAMYSITTAMGELDPLAFSPAPPQQVLGFQQITPGVV